MNTNIKKTKRTSIIVAIAMVVGILAGCQSEIEILDNSRYVSW